MRTLALLRSGARQNLGRTAGLVSLAGVGNVVLIAVINQAAEKAASSDPIGVRLVILYLLGFGFFFYANRMALMEANDLLQHRLAMLRRQMVEKIRRTPLRTLERIGQGDLISVLGHETNQLAQTLPLFVGATQSLFLLNFCLIYLAFISVHAFIGIAALTAAGILFFWRQRLSLEQSLRRIHNHEAAVVERVMDFTEGFTEVRLNADKNDALYRHFVETTEELETAQSKVGSKWVVLLQYTNAQIYALLGLTIFVMPVIFSDFSEVIHKVVAVAIFCMGSVTSLTSASQVYTKAEVGLENVARMEAILDEAAMPRAPVVEQSRFKDFRRIEMEGMTFHYRNDDNEVLFTSGPWSLTLERGEIVFLTGGNGSGKSTAVKMLCGLYAPDAGTIRVDGEVVEGGSRQDFRELFGAIFPDFHLFSRLHGLPDIEPERVHAMLARMGLQDKVTYADGEFSTLALSTGQRKRLAMVVTLLEDQEIFLFDEWAADQDSGFREVFYHDLLPELRSRGKTVIAVTHDDRFWSCCDRRLHMDLGQLMPAPDHAPAGTGDR